MKTLFICDDFVLDLTGKTLEWTEENSWFDSEIILNSTFPFEINYDELPFFIQYKTHNPAELEYKFEGVLQRPDGRLTPAQLEIEEMTIGLKGIIRDGIELFPSWKKMLRQLNLGVVDVPDMLTHALTKVNLTYPATTYNFPCIRVWDVYKDDDNLKEFFRGFYNLMNWSGTAFQMNFMNPETNTYVNLNMVYPMPYWLHILKTGIEEGGYTLHGDILNDPEFKIAIMPPKKLVINERPETIELVLDFDVATHQGDRFWMYEDSFTLDPNIDYKVVGKFVYMQKIKIPYFGYINYLDHAAIRYNGAVLYEINKNTPKSAYSMTINIPSGEGGELKIFARYRLLTEPFQLPAMFEGEAIPTHIYDVDGNPIIPIANFNKVDLALNLPEVTFGDFVKVICKWRNYDFDLRDGKQIWMNLIENEMQHSDAVILKNHEVEFPERKKYTSKGCVIEFSEENEEYPLEKTYVSLGGMQVDDYEAEEDALNISIDAIPWPVVDSPQFGEVDPGSPEALPIRTAKIYNDEDSKIGLVLYDGLNDDNHNWTKPIDNLLTPFTADKYYFKFLLFQFRAIQYNWTVYGNRSEFMNLTKRSKIFAYNNYMVVKSLNRKKTDDSEIIEIEALTF